MKRKLLKVIVFIFFILFLTKVNAINKYEKYNIGDEFSYKDIDFYVIGGNNEDDSEIILLKAKPLTTTEVYKYGIEDGVNYINKHARARSPGEFKTYDGYGYVAYYSSPTCGFTGYDLDTSGCSEENATDYEASDAKHFVDNWTKEVFNDDEKFISARLISFDDLKIILKCSNEEECNEKIKDAKYVWLNGSDSYWTMSQYHSEDNRIWEIAGDVLGLRAFTVYGNLVGSAIRPVLTIKKDIVEVIDDDSNGDIKEDDVKETNDDVVIDDKNEKVVVSVPNTYERLSLFIIIVGFVLAIIGVVFYYLINNGKIRIFKK